MAENDNPVFIVGGGRSGTTILYELLAMHRDVCWFSNLTDSMPGRPEVSRVHRILDIPRVGDRLRTRIPTKQRYVLRPSEAGRIYSRCGFDDTRKMTEQDLGEIDADLFKKTIDVHLQSTGKTRFLNKQTGNNQRIRMIHALFPHAYYVHIIRDGRAVANSFSRVPWWDDLAIWWTGGTPREWGEHGRPRIELCALHWKMELMEILDYKKALGRYLELRYEDLVANTRSLLETICHFARLEWSPKYERLLPATLPGMNHKWKENLTTEEQSIVSRTIGDVLHDLGYLAT